MGVRVEVQVGIPRQKAESRDILPAWIDVEIIALPQIGYDGPPSVLVGRVIGNDLDTGPDFQSGGAHAVEEGHGMRIAADGPFGGVDILEVIEIAKDDARMLLQVGIGARGSERPAKAVGR